MIKSSTRVQSSFKSLHGLTRGFSLRFAQRCDTGGQGASFKVHHTQSPLDFTYATFWNDFTHYSIYDQAKDNESQNPEYRARELLKTGGEDNHIFEDREKYQNYNDSDSIASFVQSEQSFSHGQSTKLETLTIKPSTTDLEVQAWIPEDFNLDVRVRGHINGVNMKDTKLISKNLQLISEEGSITTRRLRNDMCVIEAQKGDVNIGSYVESGDLLIKVGNGEIKVAKRLGIVKNGRVETHGGKLKVSSIFSQMANLPEKALAGKEFYVQQQEFLKIMGQLSQNEVSGLLVKGCSQVSIDNLQGVVSIDNPTPCQVHIAAMESGLLKLRVPASHVRLGHLKSLHDTSFLDCDSLEVILSDDFDTCHIFDIKTSTFLDPLAKDTQTPDPALPILFVQAHSGKIDIKVMTRFEILRRSIQERVHAKQSQIERQEAEKSSRKTQRY